MQALRLQNLFSVGALALLCQGAAADTLRVPKDFATLDAAVKAASEGDEILISKGVYDGGLVITGLDHVTIRAKGKVVFRPAPEAEGDPHGLAFSLCSDLTLEGLRFEGFDIGLNIEKSNRVIVRDVRISEVETAFFGVDVNHILVQRLQVSDAKNGINVGDFTSFTIDDVDIDVQSHGIATEGCERLVVRESRIRSEMIGVFIGGLPAEGDVLDNVILGGDSGAGIVMFGPQVRIHGNLIRGFDLGMQALFGSAQVGSSIVGNRIMNCAGGGIFSDHPRAIVSGNLIKNVGGDALIVMGENNRLLDNKITGAGGRGLWVRADGASVIGNRIKKSGVADIDDEGAGTFFVDNVTSDGTP